MFSHSWKSVRVTDIPSDTEEGVLTQLAEDIVVSQSGLGKWKIKSLVGRVHVDFSKPVTSLAPQLRHKTGTITFSSEELKKQALGYGGENPYSIDDIFNGTTVLYSTANPDLE
jgi:hypothetical protein